MSQAWLCGLEPILVIEYICTYCWSLITQTPVISLRLRNSTTWDGCGSLDHWGKPERRRHVIACTHGAVCATKKDACSFGSEIPAACTRLNSGPARLASQRPPINMRIMTTRRTGMMSLKGSIELCSVEGGWGAQIGNWNSTHRVCEEKGFPTEQFIEVFISLNDEKLHLIKQNPHSCFVVVNVGMLETTVLQEVTREHWLSVGMHRFFFFF